MSLRWGNGSGIKRIYKQLEGKKVEVDEILPARGAHPVIEASFSVYRKKYSHRRHKKSKSQ